MSHQTLPLFQSSLESVVINDVSATISDGHLLVTAVAL